jgi:hypothetical protein
MKLAIDQLEQEIDALQRAQTVRNRHNVTPTRARGKNRLRQRPFALGVEIGVGLVEHEQERIA